MGLPAHQMPDQTQPSLKARLSKPFLVLAPLMAALLIPATVFGLRSNTVAAEIDQAMTDAIVEHSDGVTINNDNICAEANAELADLRLHELATSESTTEKETRKSSVSGLRFASGTVDFKGWLNEPDQDTQASSALDQLDLRDDISFFLELEENGEWCVRDFNVRRTD